MYKFYNILKRDFINLWINPMWIFYCIPFPFLMIVILGYLTEGIYGTNVTSYDYYSIVMVIYSAFMSATLAANSFMEERIVKGNMRLLYSPIPKSFVYMSKLIATTIFNSICLLIVYLMLKVFCNVNLGGAYFGYLMLLTTVFVFFSSAFGILFTIIFKKENTANQCISIIINISAVLGGVFFRVASLGTFVKNLSVISPIKWVAKVSFSIIYDNSTAGLLPLSVILILISIGCILISEKLFKQEDYLC